MENCVALELYHKNRGTTLRTVELFVDPLPQKC